ncbi:lysozyme family protein [Candidatus Methylacidithermus pantelleriae]|uniref:Peptidoglycan binding domain protein n=1 Tax=Candidatus Methylacidithermus pantelleriae TaxID=2744239 RepID=A0A8J2BTY9_9BACT|nr:hypothetical protein [Candidatus Methylacidithermus pantelleriae]CAF0700339.1 hypothetical protein MPNT_350017 [Candidatus Methylacidithermus pantelleriae]
MIFDSEEERRVRQLAIETILDLEGRYHEYVPEDPGGRTAYGFDERTYGREFVDSLDERGATRAYEELWKEGGYWKLPPSWAFPLFIQGHNIGEVNAIKKMQESLGLPPTGVLDSTTIAKAHQNPDPSAFLEKNLEYYTSLHDLFPKFGRGWFARVGQIVDTLKNELGFGQIDLSKIPKAQHEYLASIFGPKVPDIFQRLQGGSMPTTEEKKRLEQERGVKAYPPEYLATFKEEKTEKEKTSLSPERAKKEIEELESVAQHARKRAEEIASRPEPKGVVDRDKQKSTAASWFFLLFPLAVVAGVASRGAGLGFLTALGGFFSGLNNGYQWAMEQRRKEMEEHLKTIREDMKEEREWVKLFLAAKKGIQERMRSINELGTQRGNPFLARLKTPAEVDAFLQISNAYDRILSAYQEPGKLMMGFAPHFKQEGPLEEGFRKTLAQNVLDTVDPNLKNTEPDVYQKALVEVIYESIQNIHDGAIKPLLENLTSNRLYDVVEDLWKLGEIPMSKTGTRVSEKLVSTYQPVIEQIRKFRQQMIRRTPEIIEMSRRAKAELGYTTTPQAYTPTPAAPEEESPRDIPDKELEDLGLLSVEPEEP